MDEFNDMKAPRACGFSEADLFEYLDGDLDAAPARAFTSHLDGCPVCRKDLAAYRNLATSLNALHALEPKPAFDDEILARVLPARAPIAVHRPRPFEALARWFGGLPTPVRAYASAGAVIGVVVLTLLTLYAQSVGGPEKLANRTIVQATQAGAGMVTDGARQVITAVKVSDVLMKLAVTFRPVARSLTIAFEAVGPEFWFLTMLVSLLVLLGAVRLASGPVVGEGGHHVRLFC